jgi:hypothetical protein
MYEQHDSSGLTKFAYEITDQIDDDFEAIITVTSLPSSDPNHRPYTKTVTVTRDSLTGVFDGALSALFYHVDLILTTFDDEGKPKGTFEYRDTAHVYYNMAITFRYTLTNNLVIVPEPDPDPGNGGVQIFIDYEHPKGFQFTFKIISSTNSYGPNSPIGSGTKDDPFILSKTVESQTPTMTIDIESADITVYKWFNGSTQIGTPNEQLVLTAADLLNGNDPSLSNVFAVTLEGIYNGEPFTINDADLSKDGTIYVMVVDR